MKTYCTACGKDCSNAYGTWKGDAYHIMCIPSRRTPPTLAIESLDGRDTYLDGDYAKTGSVDNPEWGR